MNASEIRYIEAHLQAEPRLPLSDYQMAALIRQAKRERAEAIAGMFSAPRRAHRGLLPRPARERRDPDRRRPAPQLNTGCARRGFLLPPPSAAGFVPLRTQVRGGTALFDLQNRVCPYFSAIVFHISTSRRAVQMRGCLMPRASS